jgi:lipoate---protein ligase
MKLRLIDTVSPGDVPGLKAGPLSGALNMGIDEALIASVSRGEAPPTLRLYRWSPPCVTVGYFQGLDAEVDLEACRAAGVDAVRRLTGGGAVFHDAEITYSIVLPLGHPLAPDEILESYRRICGGLLAGLRELGVEADFAPINDIVACGKKISGNAQTRRELCLLQHGTVLMDLEPELMFSLLKVPAEKMKGRLIEDVRARVTSLRALLGRDPPYEEVALALRRGFAKAWEADFEEAPLSKAEASEARSLAETRFSQPEWNARR